MSKKLSQLEKAIANFDHEVAVLQAARQKVVEQQAKQPKRKQAMTSGTFRDVSVDHVDPRD